MRKITHLLISLAFRECQRLRRIVTRCMGKEIAGSCVVLYYHEIRAEHRKRFGRQMDILMSIARPTGTDRREPLPPGSQYAAVTFDDGFLNVVENGLPELEKRGIPATLFIITEAVGGYPTWLTDPTNSATHEPIMSVADLQQLPGNLVAIGSHTLTHPRLSEISEVDAQREISESRRRLEALLDRPVKEFSFPYGCMSARLVELCRQAGYDRVFTTSPVAAFADPEEFVTGRVPVEPTDWPLEFRLKVQGAYGWLATAIRIKQAGRAVLQFGRAQPPRAAVAGSK